MNFYYYGILLAGISFLSSIAAETGGNSTTTVLCVTNGINSGCPLKNDVNYTTVERLSDATSNLEDYKTVQLYLTSGIHVLDSNLDFPKSVEHTEIHGAHEGQRSTVTCQQAAGIRFIDSKNIGRVFISHVTFVACERTVMNGRKKYKNITAAALLFWNVSYAVQDVTIKNSSGYAIFAFQCRKQKIVDSSFVANSRGHIFISLEYYTKHSLKTSRIEINDTYFDGQESGTDSYGINVTIGKDADCQIWISNCVFRRTAGGHLLLEYAPSALKKGANASVCVHIDNSNFAKAKGSTYGVSLLFQGEHTVENVTILNCNLTHNSNGTLQISGAHEVLIKGCDVSRNGITGNELAHSAESTASNINFTNIERLVVEESSFQGNQGMHRNCSCVTVSNGSIILSDVSFTDNHCTGITLQASTMIVSNWLNMTRNSGMMGGAIRMLMTQSIKKNEVTKDFSSIMLNPSARLRIEGNNASLYGGGIYTDETCEDIADNSCFIQFKETLPDKAPIGFSNNSAELGGNAIFGGCLSNCFKNSNVSHFMSFHDKQFNSTTFAEYPTKVAFCSSKKHLDPWTENTCKQHENVAAYRGQRFRVPLIVADSHCTSSVKFVQARTKESGAKLGELCRGESIKQSSKYCKEYVYIVKANSSLSSVNVELFIHQERAPASPPAMLTVHLSDCPVGFQVSDTEQECVCNEVLKSRGIECQASNHALVVPPWTWIGEIDGRPAVSKYCQLCRNQGKVNLSHEIQNSHKMCARRRTGVLCGKCSDGNSLLLGGNKCGECSSTWKGVLLLLAFMLLGIAMVLVILVLNLTVSTGMINGLIFYSNMIHLNSNTFLPIDGELNNKHLNNAVKFLSTFQAWINLDFGIVTCFFDGYNTYISTWLQFAFPLYIWLLILIIVLASRYSTRISKLTTSNTVSVLATLLLLAYAKLLQTSIDAVSLTDVQFLADESKLRLWMLDGNIGYLSGKHIFLFVMSLLTIVLYILPFTFLILLGPMLQAKSQHRLFMWVNKLTPFLDAYYGPYTSRYRYWPGILLLVRLIVFGIFAFYSLGDNPFKLATVSIMVAVLFATWMLIGKTQNTSLHEKMRSNVLELFFLVNFGIFAISTTYISSGSTGNKLTHQQGLAVVMVGSVLLVFCGILAHQLCYIVLRHTRLGRLVGKKPVDGTEVEMSPTSMQETEDTNSKPTQSSLEMTENSNNELREPLLINSY